MRFLEKLKNAATGKTELERLQEAAATKIIKEQVNSARLRTRREEAIKFATETEKLKYKKRLDALKQPRVPMGMNFNFGTPFGQPRQLPATRRVIPKRKIVTINRKQYYSTSAPRRRTRRVRVRRVSAPQTQAPKQFDVISGTWR